MTTITELTATLTADLETLQQDIANAQQYLVERQTMLLKTQGALEALALLDSGQRPQSERRADAEHEGESQAG